MIDDYVTFEQAKDLKDLGFPQSDLLDYYDDGCCSSTYERYSKPTLYAVKKWLRKNKNIWINVYADTEDVEHDNWKTIYKEQVCYGENNTIVSNLGIFTHQSEEDALISGINKSIKLLKRRLKIYD